MTSIQEKKWRLFFALWPSETERTALALWQPRLHELCGGRAMRPATLHVTLVFLGEVAENRLEALQLAAREVDFQRKRISYDKLTKRWCGVFAEMRYSIPKNAKIGQV